MDQYGQSQPNNRYRDWWHRLVAHLGARLGSVEAREYANGILETFISEEPVAREYCRHSRFTRFVARVQQKLLSRVRPDLKILAQSNSLCPLCSKLPIGQASVEYVLTVWFCDGDAYDFAFNNRRPYRCYRLTDSGLYIFMKESTVSYPLETITALNFGARTNPPAAPEVVEAERIISGFYSES
jgi:hypothetical protein